MKTAADILSQVFQRDTPEIPHADALFDMILSAMQEYLNQDGFPVEVDVAGFKGRFESDADAKAFSDRCIYYQNKYTVAVNTSVCAKCGGKGYYLIGSGVTTAVQCSCQQIGLPVSIQPVPLLPEVGVREKPDFKNTPLPDDVFHPVDWKKGILYAWDTYVTPLNSELLKLKSEKVKLEEDFNEAIAIAKEHSHTIIELKEENEKLQAALANGSEVMQDDSADYKQHIHELTECLKRLQFAKQAKLLSDKHSVWEIVEKLLEGS